MMRRRRLALTGYACAAMTGSCSALALGFGLIAFRLGHPITAGYGFAVGFANAYWCCSILHDVRWDLRSDALLLRHPAAAPCKGESMFTGLLRVLQFLRVVDQQGNLSISNLAVIGAAANLYLGDHNGLQHAMTEFGPLALALLNYTAKRYIDRGKVDVGTQLAELAAVLAQPPSTPPPGPAAPLARSR